MYNADCVLNSVDTQSIFTKAEELVCEVTGLRLALKDRDERIAFHEAENERLREMLVKLQKHAFGTRSERWETEEQGKLVFNEAEVEAAKPEAGGGADGEETEQKLVTVKEHKKKPRGKRKPLPEHLPREVVVVELPESQRTASDGTPLTVIGKEVSEKLEYEPAKMKVIEYHRLRYGAAAGDHEKTAPPVPSIIPKGIATPSLLAAIVTSKYADGLPLYRQEEIFSRLRIELSRTSMARWVVQAAAAAQPLWNALEERLLESSYLSCDETHVQVLKEEGRKAETKSWMWVRSNPTAKEQIILFDYDPHRSGDVAKRLLGGYSGWLQVDGYGAYNAVESQSGLIRIGCNMHGRRGFRDAADGSSKSKGLAQVALKYYRSLYDIEEEAREKALTPETRHELRQERAVPIWAEFKAWAEGAAPKVPKKSSIGQALHYFLGEYDYLVGYLKDGQLEIDNGHVERMIRKFAIGRNNWIFSDTPAGANASALFYSLVVTAKVNGVNPFEALKIIFTELPLARTVDDYERLADLLLRRKPPP